MENFGRDLGCVLFGLGALAASGWLAAIVLGVLIVAGVL